MNEQVLERKEIKNSPLLYLSKVQNLYNCPTKYYYIHHRQIGTKGENPNFVFGRIVHSAAEIFFNTNSFDKGAESIRFSELTSDQQQLAIELFSIFVAKIGEIRDFQLFQTEESVKIPTISPYFTNWVVKCDFVHSENNELWNDDIKTTSTTGPAIAQYYHNSMQTLTYLRGMHVKQPEIVGTKMWILTKKKPRCEIEDIRVTKEKLTRAEIFMEEAVSFANSIEKKILAGDPIPKFLLSCHSYIGNQECPYLPLCFQANSERQRELLIQDWYVQKDPDDHLSLGGE